MARQKLVHRKHSYFIEDTPSRKVYFERQFLILASKRARQLGMSLQSYLSDIRDVNSFMNKLQDASDALDPSLSAYFNGMRPNDLSEFFNRSKIQDIVDNNLQLEQLGREKLEAQELARQKRDLIERFPVNPKELPKQEHMVDKKRVEVFSGKRKEIATGKEFRAVGRKETVMVLGKPQIRFRDSKGRFISVSQ